MILLSVRHFFDYFDFVLIINDSIRLNEHSLLIYRVDMLNLLCFPMITTGNRCKFSWKTLIMWASDESDDGFGIAFWVLEFRMRTQTRIFALINRWYWPTGQRSMFHLVQWRPDRHWFASISFPYCAIFFYSHFQIPSCVTFTGHFNWV